MVKRDLIAQLAQGFPGIRRDDMEAIVNAMFESMAEALVRGEHVEFRGVGHFKVTCRRAIQGKNPKTLEPVHVPKRWGVHFRPAESFVTQLNEFKD